MCILYRVMYTCNVHTCVSVYECMFLCVCVCRYVWVCAHIWLCIYSFFFSFINFFFENWQLRSYFNAGLHLDIFIYSHRLKFFFLNVFPRHSHLYFKESDVDSIFNRLYFNINYISNFLKIFARNVFLQIEDITEVGKDNSVISRLIITKYGIRIFTFVSKQTKSILLECRCNLHVINKASYRLAKIKIIFFF